MADYAIEVHSLKSDVRYLGFMALGDLAYDLELKSKANDISGVDSRHNELIDEVNKAIRICNNYLYGEDKAIKTVDMGEEKIDFKDVNSLDPMSQAIIYQDKNRVVENTSGPKEI